MAQPNPTPHHPVALAWHRFAGWACFRICAWERSRVHYERVIALVGEDFDALVRLGRVAYKLGDYASWKRECGRARRVDPERYGRLKHPFELFEPRTGRAADAADPAGNTEAVALRAGNVLGNEPGDDPAHSTEGLSTDDRPGLDAQRGFGRRHAAGSDGTPDLAIGDDFCSDAERARFRELTPIESNAVAEVDLDDLARRLIG